MSNTPRCHAALKSQQHRGLDTVSCLCEISLLAIQLERENAALRKTGNALREYLVSKVGPIEDIPDEVFKPFIEALEVKP